MLVRQHTWLAGQLLGLVQPKLFCVQLPGAAHEPCMAPVMKQHTCPTAHVVPLHTSG
jgi:hypothetical protein